MREWHLITCEYPPQPGGVSDHTFLTASGLARAGDTVHVWCPQTTGPTPHAPAPDAPGVTVHRALGRLAPPDLHAAGRALDHYAAPRRLLVQWVPHGYGWQAMNLPFCVWIWCRSRQRRDRIEIVLHEPFLPLSRFALKQTAAALVQRVMAMVLLRAADRIWATADAWKHRWRPYALGRAVEFRQLPVPSTIPVIDDPAGAARIRSLYVSAGGFLLGHFGDGGRPIAEMLARALPLATRSLPESAVLLLGRHSEALRTCLVVAAPELSQRVHATGLLPAPDVSRHLSACDLMVQPYPDGVDTRRTSAMACLAHGLATVTTAGRLTDPVWAGSGAVALSPAGDDAALASRIADLLADGQERMRMAVASGAFYRARFALEHVIDALRAAS